jgi:hypothetical protein
VLWRKACQPIADWLAQSFFRAAGLRAVATAEDVRIHAPHTIPPKPFEQGQRLDPPTGPLRVFIAPGGGYRQTRGRGGFRDDPVPLMWWECGKALAGRQSRFCSSDCVTAFSAAHGKYPPAKAAALECEPSKRWEGSLMRPLNLEPPEGGMIADAVGCSARDRRPRLAVRRRVTWRNRCIFLGVSQWRQLSIP